MATKQELEVAGRKAGIIDVDAVALADASKAADESIAKLKADKPFLFAPKRAKDMSEAEKQAFWREHKLKFPW